MAPDSGHVIIGKGETNLDQEFDELSLLDLTFMEYMIYGMQLKKYGMPDRKIQNAINALFQRHIVFFDD